MDKAQPRATRFAATAGPSMAPDPRSTASMSGVEVAAHRRSGGAGRAYVEVFEVQPGVWGLLVGQARGASATPRALAAVARSAILAAREQGSPPAAVLEAVNRHLDPGLQPGDRGSAVFGRLEPDACGAWVTLACAGRPQAIVVRRAGWIDVRGQRGTTFGSAAFDVDDDRVGLGPGDALVLYNDGLPDLRGRSGDLFGDEALPAALLEHSGEDAATVATCLMAAAERHAGGLPDDDLVVLALHVPEGWPDAHRIEHDSATEDDVTRGGPRYPVGEPYWGRRSRPAPPREARIKLAADLAAVGRARHFVDSVLHSWRMSPLTEGDAQLITSELATNAVRHAGSPFTVLVNYDGARVRIGVGDGSRVIPQTEPAREDLDALGGRGLALVISCSVDWGVTTTAEGKRIWAEIEVPADDGGSERPARA